MTSPHRSRTLDDGASRGNFCFVPHSLKYYLPHLIFFGVFLAALIPVLYYYQRRNPHPRFRPGAGEMTMIVVFALTIGGGACYFLGNVFRGEQKQFQNPDYGAGWSAGVNAPQEDKDDSRSRKD